MNERDISKKVVQVLNQGTKTLGTDKTARLQIAREKAMEAFNQQAAGKGLLAVAGSSMDIQAWARKPSLWLALAVLVSGLLFFNQGNDDISDDGIGELDAQLLTGELPINAFLDKDFQSWVKDSSQH